MVDSDMSDRQFVLLGKNSPQGLMAASPKIYALNLKVYGDEECVAHDVICMRKSEAITLEGKIDVLIKCYVVMGWI